MTISDLIVVATGLGSLGLFFVTLGAVFLGRWTFVSRSFVVLAVFWGFYLAVGTAIAVLTPQRIQPIGADRCFDEICFATSRFRRVSSIKDGDQTTYAHGVFYIVDVRISSRSRGRAQHEMGRKGIMIDEFARVYDVSAEGTKALAAAEGPSPGLGIDLDPGEIALAKLTFDLPTDVKRPGFALESSLVFYPPRIILGDEMHFLHKPTITPLE